MDGPPAGVSDVDWGNQDDIPVTSIPTAEDLKLAAKVAHHKFLLGYMAKMLDHPRWRMSDRRPRTATPADPAVSLSSQAPSSLAVANLGNSDGNGNGNSKKRRRTKGPERNVSLPARLHASTRRTRTRLSPRTLPVKARS